MRIIIFPLLLISQFCFTQTEKDYKIYSKLIGNQMLDWKINNDSSQVICITNRLTSFSSRVNFKEYIDMLFGSDRQMAYMTANYKDSICKLLDNPEFKELFQVFADNYDEEQYLENTKFFLPYQVTLLDCEWIEFLFGHSENVNYKNAWKKFYKKNPNSPGYFEVSKIEYSENFGLVYIVHRAKPLIGGGKLIILKKVKDDWFKYDYLTIWYD
jgi:hypothetical protein